VEIRPSVTVSACKPRGQVPVHALLETSHVGGGGYVDPDVLPGGVEYILLGSQTEVVLR
jgi:hypothetical protein